MDKIFHLQKLRQGMWLVGWGREKREKLASDSMGVFGFID
jgi:hypothetical protein